MSGYNVVIATESWGTQQLVKICRLIVHGWLLVRVDRMFSSVEKDINDEMEVIFSEAIFSSCVVLKRKTNDERKIRQYVFPPISEDHFWRPDNDDGIFFVYVSLYVTGHSRSFYHFVHIHGDTCQCFLNIHGD